MNKLEELTGLSRDQILVELQHRLKVSEDQLAHHTQVEPEITRWLTELWAVERNECEANQLWSVDQKYSKILAKLTVQEFVNIMSKSEIPTKK